jgi:hypothetical protein
MNFDEIKEKIKRGEYILMEKNTCWIEVWKPFRQIQDAKTKEKICAVQCLKCQSVLSYSAKNKVKLHI